MEVVTSKIMWWRSFFLSWAFFSIACDQSSISEKEKKEEVVYKITYSPSCSVLRVYYSEEHPAGRSHYIEFKPIESSLKVRLSNVGTSIEQIYKEEYDKRYQHEGEL